MEYGIQSMLKKLGDEGCYFLCLLKACNVPNSKVIDAYCECLGRELIEEDCYVNDPVAVLRLFGMDAVRVNKVDAGRAISGQPLLIVACYEWNRQSHFVIISKDGVWDPLGESKTVKNGRAKSYRVFY